MNNNNFTDNNNSIIIDSETGEVAEIAEERITTGADILHENEPKTVNTSVSKDQQPRYIFFNAREWKPSKECDKTVANRSFISDPFGGLTETYTVGDWSWNWSQIETKDMTLEKNTDYQFVFWLNGGENDRNQEVCRFEVMFDNDHENRFIYNLNRNFIRYIKHYKGWYLYSIPFNTGDASCTKFRFVAQSAYSTLMKAQPVESYNDLPEDIPPKGIPQRHNIVFSEGWPRNSWWSKMIFHDEDSGANSGSDNSDGSFFENLFGKHGKYGNIAESVRSRIEEEFDPDEIVDDIVEEVMGDIDVDSIKEDIIRKIKNGKDISGGFFDKYMGRHGGIAESVHRRIEEELEDELDPDNIVDEIAEMMMNDIDVDTVREKIIRQIRDSMR